MVCTYSNFSGDPYYGPLVLSKSDLGSQEIRRVLITGLVGISAIDKLILSFIVVTMNSRDRYEIIGLCKISHLIKQPCSSTVFA